MRDLINPASELYLKYPLSIDVEQSPIRVFRSPCAPLPDYSPQSVAQAGLPLCGMGV
jgi:hypothetical protein